MAATKDTLRQYASLKAEAEETREKIKKLNESIRKIEERIYEMNEGEVVKDRVYGGEGGIQAYNIEGFPTAEYDLRMLQLKNKKKILASRVEGLNSLEEMISVQIRDVEAFIRSINNSKIRRIITLRFLDGLNWYDVADRIGGDATSDSCRKLFERFIEKS